MYQEFFNLQALPFSLTPNPEFFCRLKGHQEALDTLEFSIKSGEGFIKIVGEVGSGKTLLCRKLLNSLDKEKYVTAYIPNPDLSPNELRKAVAHELGLEQAKHQDQHELLNTIYERLIDLHNQNKHVVLIIDEAQALGDESLETVRLLTNLETEHHKLMQVILFGQPELDNRLNKPNLRQMRQRITFSYRLPLLSKSDLETYLHHRLAVAGFTHGSLFTRKAKQLLYRASLGTPRIINILCHKALLVAYGRGVKMVDQKSIRMAIKDTEVAIANDKIHHKNILSLLSLITLSFILLLWYLA